MRLVHPVIVGEIGNVAAVGEIAQHGVERAAPEVRVHATMPHRGRIAEVEQRHRLIGRSVLERLLDDAAVTHRLVDTEHDLDAARMRLPEHRHERILERRTHDGADHDSRVERRLQIESRLAKIPDNAHIDTPAAPRP